MELGNDSKSRLTLEGARLRVVTTALMGGGGRSARRISFEISCHYSCVKRNSSGRTRIYEYAPPRPPINALVSALARSLGGTDVRHYFATITCSFG